MPSLKKILIGFDFFFLLRKIANQVGSYYVRSELQNYTTVESLRQHIQEQGINEVAKNISRYASSVRGTRPFWIKRKNELLAMIHQLGPPILFCTFSSADNYWPELTY